MIEPAASPERLRDLLHGIDRVFESLGRAVLCLNREWRIVHASSGLDALVGAGAAEAVLGRAAEEVLGGELFGPAGTLRRAVEAGERREGWGAAMTIFAGPPRRPAPTAAPLHEADGNYCDPNVAYLIVLRSAEEALASGSTEVTLFAGLVARSPGMLRIFKLVETLAESDATVLLTGESGTGKELLARALHLHSPRRAGAFVAVNCAALPGELLESELFGHVRGAFTGALRDRTGRFELATHGTLFLDEVGDLPLALQGKLLRVLQERTFERVGDSHTRQADVRILAACNQDLRSAVRAGTFREDLYYRLRVVPIEVPPLRARREDIEPLARHLLAHAARRHGREVRLSPEALRALLAYDWPGNVRELANALEFATAVCGGQTILPTDLPPEVHEPPPAAATFALAEPTPGAAGPHAAERARLLAALEACHWQRHLAAHRLGMSRTTLWRKMRELALVR